MSNKDEIKRKRPAIILKPLGLTERLPPKNAIGKDVIMKEINILLSKQPALMYRTDAIKATTIFRIREVGFIVSGVNDKRAITARYPDAPA